MRSKLVMRGPRWGGKPAPHEVIEYEPQRPNGLGNRRSFRPRAWGARPEIKGETWRHDPLILDRLVLQRKLRCQGVTSAHRIAAALSDLHRERGIPTPCSERTVYDDWKRIRQLQAEEMRAVAGDDAQQRQQHIDALNRVKQSAWEAFDSTKSTSLNRSAYLNVIRGCEESIAKIDGTMTKRPQLNVNVDARSINVSGGIGEEASRDELVKVMALQIEHIPELRKVAGRMAEADNAGMPRGQRPEDVIERLRNDRELVGLPPIRVVDGEVVSDDPPRDDGPSSEISADSALTAEADTG